GAGRFRSAGATQASRASRSSRVACRGRSEYAQKRDPGGAGVKAARQGRRQMQLGMIGLGRMGGNIVRRLMRKGHDCIVFDQSAKATDEFAKVGATAGSDLADLVAKLTKPRAVWMMLPAGKITEDTVEQLSKLLEK